YALKNIKLDYVQSISLDEKMMIESRINSIQRAYDERGITYKNLIFAKNEIAFVGEFLRTRRDVAEQTARLTNLDPDVNAEFKRAVDEVNFSAEKNLPLLRYE